MSRSVQYQLIKEKAKESSVYSLCQFFGVSRSSYYRFGQIKRSTSKEEILAELIRQCHQKARQTYGYRRVKLWLLREKRLQVNSKRILRVMKKYQLLSAIRRKRKYIPKGISHHRYPNRLNQNFTAIQKNQKWVTDISYIHTCEGILYLSMIRDLFDQSVISYEMSTSPNTELVLSTLKKAKKKVTVSLQLHSDQGLQYTSHAYFHLTQEYGIVPSMSRKGHCYDNAPAENFFSILKTECIYQKKPKTFAEARRMIREYIWFYNHERIQLKTGLTPLEKRRQSA